MFKSLLHSRPYATFDAHNKNHRMEYFKFLQTNTWSNCPVQFMVEAPYTELPHEINNKLVRYYFNKEFIKKDKKNGNL
jgi:hypothetical protein